jgi:FAD/FMN-containing dehydrogenase
VREIAPIASVTDLQRALERAARSGQAVCVAGGRHAMGAQQFARDSMMLDMTSFNRVRTFDGREESAVEAGIVARVDRYLLKTQAASSAVE